MEGSPLEQVGPAQRRMKLRPRGYLGRHVQHGHPTHPVPEINPHRFVGGQVITMLRGILVALVPEGEAHRKGKHAQNCDRFGEHEPSDGSRCVVGNAIGFSEPIAQ